VVGGSVSASVASTVELGKSADSDVLAEIDVAGNGS